MRGKSKIQHILNALHIYCRLCDIGITEKKARRVCVWYERKVHRRMYGNKEDMC
jgi:hypothetical protein